MSTTKVRKKWMILGALALSLLFASAVLANGSPSISWWVIGGGGGSTMVGGTSLDSTIGQWLVGSDESGGLQVSPGFWGGGWDEDRHILFFLPLVMKDSL